MKFNSLVKIIFVVMCLLSSTNGQEYIRDNSESRHISSFSEKFSFPSPVKMMVFALVATSNTVFAWDPMSNCPTTCKHYMYPPCPVDTGCITPTNDMGCYRCPSNNPGGG